MKTRIRYTVLLLAILAIVSPGSGGVGGEDLPVAQSAGVCPAHPCSSDADCPRGLICCPTTGFCSTVRGCRL